MFVEFCASPDADGCSLSHDEFAVIKHAVETIDVHMSSKDTTSQDVRLWVLVKDRTSASGKRYIAYLTVGPFKGKLYLNLRDYWYPNGPTGGLARTQRGIALNLEDWTAFEGLIATIECKWEQAEEYLSPSPNQMIISAGDTLEEDSQIITLE